MREATLKPLPRRIDRAHVVGSPIHALGWAEALSTIEDWAQRRESRYVCICNAHSVVTASRDAEFARIIEAADLATPDGAPVAWMLRRLGFQGQERINGPDLMVKYCAQAAMTREPLFLYGGTEEALAKLQENLMRRYPTLNIVGTISPPFRALAAEEELEIVRAINASGACTVWVGLGCPKQEVWMASHKGRVNAVMVGVGAAFDYIAGTVNRAPLWMQRAGLEWLHRLASEPRRLWRRYLVTNSYFVLGALRQLAARLLTSKSF